DDDELSEIRNREIGFVFQNFNLIPRSSALKNVALPMLYAGISKSKRMARAKDLLGLVGMRERAGHQPNELSGGQKQRVAIARALANDPAILLADEPTGALDSKTGDMIMELFLKINREEGKTIVLITHSEKLASQSGRVVAVSDGKITNQ
ncbi:MAG: ABC transporter ATP-binding protein, partial [Clostridiales bacterium]|nr:ABC transporter ATP-binding protein [Clostridiales bacterium]